jgi:hypothetical protein
MFAETLVNTKNLIQLSPECRSNMIDIQESIIAIGFVVLCVKEFICSSLVCVLNGRPCIKSQNRVLFIAAAIISGSTDLVGPGLHFLFLSKHFDIRQDSLDD